MGQRRREQVAEGLAAGVADRGQILELLQSIDARASAERRERLEAFRTLSGELAALSETVDRLDGSVVPEIAGRIDDFDRTRQDWTAVLAGRGVVEPRDVDADHFSRLVALVTAAGGGEAGEIVAALTMSAAADRADLRRKVDRLDEDLAELRRNLRAVSRTFARTIRAFDPDPIEVDDDRAPDVVEGRVGCDGGRDVDELVDVPGDA